jgi:hypothetical protein
MKKTLIIVLCLVSVLCSCKRHSPVEAITTKDVFHDDIADITYIGEHFFTTNYDLSGNSGPQIDLLKFSSDGRYIENAFDLGMNGQGYFAMANDGHNLYLQSRNTCIILQLSLAGEKGYEKIDYMVNNQWQASGICYVDIKDSLVLLYRNMQYPAQYRARMVSKHEPSTASNDINFQLDSVCTTDDGIYAQSIRIVLFICWVRTNPDRISFS